MADHRTIALGNRFDLGVSRPGARMAGFTLVELVTIMIMVGILAAVAMPRMFDRTFDERGFHDATQTALQHARHVAVASRHFVCATVTAGSGPAGVVALNLDPTAPESVITVNCTATVALPAPGRGCAATNQVCAPTGVTLGTPSGSSVIFDPLGRSVDSSKNVQASAVTLTVSNQPNVTVQPETGYVQ
jgi:MSHA pilin protein MshC